MFLMRQVEGRAKGCLQSQADVIIVVPDALVRIYDDDLIATSTMTVIPSPFALGSSLIPASFDCCNVFLER